MVLAVPASIPEEMVARALRRAARPAPLDPALTRFVEIVSNVPMRAASNAWYRVHLPNATPVFSTMTYAAAIDIVAEGLATAHTPLSLLPSLPQSVRSRLTVYSIPGLDRTIVLAMPKHLMTLPGYANIYRNLVDFARHEYGRNLSPDTVLELPVSDRTRHEHAPVEPRPVA
jgi:hypothetical protein